MTAVVLAPAVRAARRVQVTGVPPIWVALASAGFDAVDVEGVGA